jgi:hypothetical protein
MKYRKIAVGYALVVGLLMTGLWLSLIFSNHNLFLQNTPQAVATSGSLAIAAFLLTAGALLTSGIALLKRKSWANTSFLLAMGALFYSLINAVSLYGQRGNIGLLIMVDITLLIGLALTVITLRQVPDIQPVTKLIEK